MEKIVEQGLLYDFYGSLLTGHQQKIYEKVVYENLSLNEVAETEGVSKQAVHDLVRRCTVIMESADMLKKMAFSGEIPKTQASVLLGIAEAICNDLES